MESFDETPPSAELEAHADFVRRLCARLVGDRDVAEDVAQETWLSFLRRPPGNDRPVTPWLRRVARNHLLQRRRAEGRRSQRERHVARSAVEPSVATTVERDMIRRAVCAALQELPEPHRATLLLRYFEELEPREIAARFNVPVETVRSRTKRGLELLRERLATRARGAEQNWALALWALAGEKPRPVLGRTFAATRTVWLGLAGAALLVLGAERALRPAPLGPEPAVSNFGPAVDSEPALAFDGASTGASRTLVRSAARAELEIRVTRASLGVPVAGARITAEPAGGEPIQAVTDARGVARFDLPAQVPIQLRRAATRELRSDSHRLGSDWAAAAVDGRVVLDNVAFDAGCASGRVLDAAGEPAEGVDVLVFGGAPEFRADGAPVDLLARATTDVDGRFGVVDLRLPFCAVAHDGESWSDLLLGSSAILDAELRLRPARRVRGSVRDESGAAIAGAILEATAVRADGETAAVERAPTWMCQTSSDANGEFELIGLPLARVSVTARQPEHGTARVELRADERTLDVSLLRGVVAEIVVLDPSGRPVSGAEVRLCCRSGARDALVTDELGRASCTDVGLGERAFWRVERSGFAVHVGAPWRSDGGGRRDVLTLEPASELVGRVTDEVGRGLPSMWVTAVPDATTAQESEHGTLGVRLSSAREVVKARTDDAGVFRLDGLGAGRYLIEARRHTNGAIHALAAWEVADGPLQLTAGSRTDRSASLHGRVLLPNGLPADAFRVRARSLDALSRPIRIDAADAQGEFEMLLPARGRWSVVVDCDDGTVPSRELLIDEPRVEAEFQLAAVRDVRVRVLDRAGARLAGASVVIRSGSPGSPEGGPSMRGVLDERGELAVLDVLPGPLQLTVRPAGTTRAFRVEIPTVAGDDGVHEVRVGGRKRP